MNDVRSADVDVAVVGAGPAGLSAALLLARCRRRIEVFDDGRPRNRGARKLHGFITRDGIEPERFRQLCRTELASYGVQVRGTSVDSVRPLHETPYRFELTYEGGKLRARGVLLATGMRDEVPDLQGLASMYGVSVHQCPFCDGYETRDQAIAVYGSGDAAAHAALGLLSWSRDVILFTGGGAAPSPKQAERLGRAGIRIVDEPILRLDGKEGVIHAIVLRSGESIARDALYLHAGQRQTSSLAQAIGCAMNEEKGTVRCDERGRTNIPRLFVAGDVDDAAYVELAIVAAGEGARAAHALHCDLRGDELPAG
jgi:thioredoxin reductase